MEPDASGIGTMQEESCGTCVLWVHGKQSSEAKKPIRRHHQRRRRLPAPTKNEGVRRVRYKISE